MLPYVEAASCFYFLGFLGVPGSISGGTALEFPQSRGAGCRAGSGGTGGAESVAAELC